MSLILSLLVATKALALKLFAGKLLLSVIPPSAPANSFFVEGISTLYWGTDGALQDAGLTTAIVKDWKDAAEVDKIQVENNSGYRVARFLLIQGRQIDFTVTDDSTKAFPGVGSKMMWKMPDDPAPIALLVVDRDYNARMKQPGERHILAEYTSAYTVV